MYAEQVIDHYENPRNAGTVPNADAVGTIGSPASGEMLKLTISVIQDTIVDARFKAFGCPTLIAVGSVLTTHIKGLSTAEALTITKQHISEALGSLPPDKMRYAIDAEELLKRTIHNYVSQRQKGTSK